MFEGKARKAEASNKWTKVLVVDDEAIIVKRLKTLLEGLGYCVTAFTDSETALEKLKSERFDVVITDLKMRKNDGMRILETARQKDKSTRVIIITGLGNWECVSEALKKGAAGCISKPFKIEDLQQAINRFSHVEHAVAESAGR